MLSSAHASTDWLLFAVIGALVCSSFAKEKYQQPGPIHLDHEGEKWAEKTLHKLSTEEKVGQLFMVWVRAKFLNVEAPSICSSATTSANTISADSP